MAQTYGAFTGISFDPDPSDESSSPKQFPDWFNTVHLAELGQVSIAQYANQPTMLANAPVPQSGEIGFAATQDTGTVYVYFSGQWRAAFSANGGAWTGIIPWWGSLNNGATTQLQLGSGNGAGALTMRYEQRGKTVIGSIKLVRGTNTNMGSGDYVFRLPIAPKDWQAVGGTGWASIPNAASGSPRPTFTVQGIGGSTVAMILNDGSGKRLGTYTGSSDGKTGVWSVGDSIVVNFTYEGA